MKKWHVKFVGFVCVINQYHVLISLCKVNRLWICNKEVVCPISRCNVNFEVYFLVLKMLNKGVIHRESMPLLPSERGIQVIYIIQLKWYCCYLAKVCNCLAWLDSYIYIYILEISLKVFNAIRLTGIV
jgi:hypothetical protein